MPQVIAVIKPFRARAVLEALREISVFGGTVREVMGYGRQKGRLHLYLGSEFDTSFLPKIELALFVPEDKLQSVLKVIVETARTGRMGDGKIIVLPCLEPALEW